MPRAAAPEPEGQGLKLVNAFLNFVKIAKPKYWLMENVPNLTNYLDLKPRIKGKICGNKFRCLWGNFPSFEIPYTPEIRMKYTGKYRSVYNAQIPMKLACALGKAIKKGIDNDIKEDKLAWKKAYDYNPLQTKLGENKI